MLQDNLEETVSIQEEITGYTLRRSVSSPYLVNVVAHNEKGDMLAVIEADMAFEDGANLVEALNSTVKVD